MVPRTSRSGRRRMGERSPGAGDRNKPLPHRNSVLRPARTGGGRAGGTALHHLAVTCLPLNSRCRRACPRHVGRKPSPRVSILLSHLPRFAPRLKTRGGGARLPGSACFIPRTDGGRFGLLLGLSRTIRRRWGWDVNAGAALSCLPPLLNAMLPDVHTTPFLAPPHPTLPRPLPTNYDNPPPPRRTCRARITPRWRRGEPAADRGVCGEYLHTTTRARLHRRAAWLYAQWLACRPAFLLARLWTRKR